MSTVPRNISPYLWDGHTEKVVLTSLSPDFSADLAFLLPPASRFSTAPDIKSTLLEMVWSNLFFEETSGTLSKHVLQSLVCPDSCNKCKTRTWDDIYMILVEVSSRAKRGEIICLGRLWSDFCTLPPGSAMLWQHVQQQQRDGLTYLCCDRAAEALCHSTTDHSNIQSARQRSHHGIRL